MTGVTAELLSAFHDRELDPGEAARLQEFLSDDGEARKLLAAFSNIDEAVRASFEADLDAPMPLALARTVRTGFAARKRRAITSIALRWAGPVAAALAIVVVGQGWSLRQAEHALEARELQIAALADRAVQDALENALSGAAISMSDPVVASTVSITPTRTYRSETQHWCREFVEDLMVDGERVTRFGLACRENDGGWQRVQTKQPGAMPPPVHRSL